ncbi:MAG: AAA family ATPase [Phycisphaeraceae bacterium]|nr:AAA family ATPase [Phycisphaeraceae bacterium]
MGETDLDRLRGVMRVTSQPAITIATPEESYALSLIRDSAADLGMVCHRWTLMGGLMDASVEDYGQISDTEAPDKALRRIARDRQPGVYVLLDLGPHLEEPKVARAMREALFRAHEQAQMLVLIDHSPVTLPIVRQYATQFEVFPPEGEEIERIVRSQLRAHHRHTPIDVSIKRSEWEAMIRNLRGLTRRQIRNIIAEVVREDHRLDSDDLHAVIARKREYVRSDGLLEFIDAPTSLDDIGGLNTLKKWLSSRLLTSEAEAAEHGLDSPRGVLMLGVQGAGKSLCAKAISAAWKRPLLRLDPTALYDRYVGESENRLRTALRQAELMAPIILWIDEIEKGFASMGSSSNDGGLSRRMFGSLLTWMQEHREPVFIVATANDIESLPPELMRKGRFDEIFFVDLPGEEARRAILSIHMRKRKLNPDDFDLPTLVEATAGFSGAEIEQGIIAARHEAFARRESVTTKGLAEVYAASPPLSVTMAERVGQLRSWARGRCVMAD